MEPKYIELTVPLESIDLHVANPRFDAVTDQRAALHAVCSDQGVKLVELAEDIVHSGISPIDIVMVLKGAEQGRYTVVEGNRRITALKLLAQPTRIEEAPFAEPLKKKMKRLAAAFDSSGHAQLRCVLAATHEDARHWIQLRHTGENKGAGVVSWDGASTARFRGNSPGYSALEFVRSQLGSSCDAEVLDRFPVTNLERLLGDPAVRKSMGLELKSGKLSSTIDPQTAAENLYVVMKDLQQPDVTVGHVYTKEDRKAYLTKIKQQLKTGTPTSTSWAVDGNGAQLAAANPTQSPSAASASKRGSKPSSKSRNQLIPRSTTFPVESTKANDIYRELRKLDIRLYPFSVAVMARVFLEISLDLYIQKHKLKAALAAVAGKQNQTLRHKVECVRSDLLAKGEEKSVINSAITKFNSASSPFSIDQLHMVVHNAHFHPDAVGLTRAWDSCEGFFLALWARM